MAGPTVVIVAMGEMGAGLAARLTARGARVRTSLAGRSAASAARAKAAGVEAMDSDRDLLDGADFVLSVVPPGEARALAKRLAPALQAVARKPAYVDCNAVSPKTAREVAEIVAPTGAPFADGGIVGGPPKGDDAGPRIYVSGPAAEAVTALRANGLDVRVVPGELSAASALKLSYASLTKGLVALGVDMILSARRAGVDDALMKELAASQPQVLAWLARQVPRMYPKAYRWVAEMQEIAQYYEDMPDDGGIHESAARMYEQLAEAAQHRGERGNPIGALDAFLAKRNPG
ncbi:MAG: NAD(P)-dependent oxidoreductase [Alphaproteobacteria bacterium]|nr:NAD(P)-dependent oxidoreductase [Alphaproteobacteria bacterium]